MNQEAEYPAAINVSTPERLDRWRPLVQWILAIPHLISFFAVLFTGRWPEGLRSWIMKSLRVSMRLNAYVMLLTDEYPPFATD